jgi:membrane protein DedA with SNARE-associated domain/rhodanese-related sulfurtransferase
VLAGVTAAGNALFALEALAVAVSASMLSDSIWFYAGRRFGRRVLGLLCQISISPDSCVRQSELKFARRGPVTLVFAKFIPGVAILASPMAGAMGMSVRNFALFNVTGIALWAGSGISFGLLFHEQAIGMLSYLSRHGYTAILLIASLLGAYIIERMWRRWKLNIALKRVPRLHPVELSALLSQGQEIFIVDVRAALGQGASTPQIPGANHFELADLHHVVVAAWSPTTKIIAYCACPNDASAMKAANTLIKRGYNAYVLTGGIDGWVSAGLPLEQDLREAVR